MTSTIVICSEIADPRWRWLEPRFTDTAIKFEFARCASGSKVWKRSPLNLARLRAAFDAVQVARRSKARAIVAHGPTPAAWCGLLARALGVKIPIVAHSFNFTMLPSPTKRRVFAFALSRVERFIVYSNMERDLYAKCFNLPPERFDVVRWGVQRPELDPVEPLESGDYVSAVGGNARDYRTLIEAAERLPDIRFVLVVRPHSLNGLRIPPNVRVHTNLPLGHVMNIVAHSRFMVLPLVGSDVPCGHVTLVAAMHLGKTLVITDSSGVSDYVRDGENGLTVPVGSVGDLATATQRLWDDHSLRDRLAENGRRFAALECSEERIVDHFRGWLQSHGLLSRPL